MEEKLFTTFIPVDVHALVADLMRRADLSVSEWITAHAVVDTFRADKARKHQEEQEALTEHARGLRWAVVTDYPSAEDRAKSPYKVGQVIQLVEDRETQFSNEYVAIAESMSDVPELSEYWSTYGDTFATVVEYKGAEGR